MSDMPEEIWAQYDESVINSRYVVGDTQDIGFGTKYIRADLVSSPVPQEDVGKALDIFNGVWSNVAWENEPKGFDEAGETIRACLQACLKGGE